MSASSRVSTRATAWGSLVQLCAPEVRNALDPDAVAALREHLCGDGPGVVVLHGVGSCFCAGGDFRALATARAAGELRDLLVAATRAFHELVEGVVASPRPVVAAIDGPAVGGGMSLALACDLRVAGAPASLVAGHLAAGAPPDGGLTTLLADAIGGAAAHGLVLRAGAIPVGSPLAPLVFDVVSDDGALDVATAEAQRLAERLEAARAAKRLSRARLLPALRAQLEREYDEVVRFASDETFLRRVAQFAQR